MLMKRLFEWYAVIMVLVMSFAFVAASFEGLHQDRPLATVIAVTLFTIL